MFIHIPQVLTGTDLATVRERLARTAWVDGKVTAGPQSARVKENLQLAEDSADAREMGALIVGTLERNPTFVSVALPRSVFPPLFNKYEPGMAFGIHVDNSIRNVPGTPYRIRTDLSATLFLTPPEEYDGGELLVEDASGPRSIKLPAGDLALYPASTLHRVAPVTRGARLASFFWVQSLVKNDSKRSILFDIDRAIIELSRSVPDSPALMRLTAAYHNLVRQWSEL